MKKYDKKVNGKTVNNQQTTNFNPLDTYHVRMDKFIRDLKTGTKNMDDWYSDLVNSLSEHIAMNHVIRGLAKKQNIVLTTWKKHYKKYRTHKDTEPNRAIHTITSDMIKIAEWYNHNPQKRSKDLSEKVNRTLHKRTDNINDAVLYAGCTDVFLELLNEQAVNRLKFDTIIVTP